VISCCTPGAVSGGTVARWGGPHGIGYEGGEGPFGVVCRYRRSGCTDSRD